MTRQGFDHAVARGRLDVLATLPYVDVLLADATELSATSLDHGPYHWEQVAMNGLRIGLVERAALPVVLAFALIHDAFRESEHGDVGHGDRAAAWAVEHADLIGLGPNLTRTLELALAGHDRGGVYLSATGGTCWDADRLELPRVGVVPDLAFFSTEKGKALAAARVVDHTVPCEHDGWRAGCRFCEAQQAIALERLGELGVRA